MSTKTKLWKLLLGPCASNLSANFHWAVTKAENGEWGMRFLTYIDVEMPHLCYICRFNVRTNLGPNPRR